MPVCQCCPVLIFPKHISDASDCADQLFHARSVNLPSQIADIDVDHVGPALIVKIPDMVLDFFTAEYDSLIVQKIFQKLEFLGREVDPLACPDYLPGTDVKREVVCCENILRAAMGRSCQYPYPGQKFVQGKGLTR